MSGYAQQERKALVELLDEVGPDAPTLCEGWLARDLAAHLVLRERHPGAALGIAVPALSSRTERVQRQIADRPFADVLATILDGPPALLRPFDEVMNVVEYFVHNEDVRRAEPPWEPRQLDQTLEDQIWRRLRHISRLAFRKAPVGVTLSRPTGETATAKSGSPVVVVSGKPSELVLFAFGRGDRAIVEFAGEAGAIASLKELRLGM